MKTIVFEDCGQDFLEWDLDDEGTVIDCRPFQSWLWKGSRIAYPDPLKVGDQPEVETSEGRYLTLKYQIIEIKENQN
jgi:hypothetical protein